MICKDINKSNKKSLNLSLKDWILLLLFADKDPIKGKLMFVKLMFLLSRELPEVECLYCFYPAKYGPYSSVLAQVLNNLIKNKIIKIQITSENDYERMDFYLSNKGLKQTEDTYKKIPDNIKNLMVELREKGKKLGYSGIIRHVYSKYPEYAIESDITEEFRHGT